MFVTQLNQGVKINKIN